MKCYRLSLFAAVVILVSLPQCAQAAMQWTEQGDAGAFLSTANETTGQGDLEAIIGMLVDDDWIDMFAIQIDDMSLFQASTDNFLEPDGTRLFDTWLYLFDSTGKGVAASGSTESSDGLGTSERHHHARFGKWCCRALLPGDHQAGCDTVQ